MASGTGRRRRARPEIAPELSTEISPQISPGLTEALPAPTGRRRRVVGEAPAIPVEIPVEIAAPAAGTGRRRRAAETPAEPTPVEPLPVEALPVEPAPATIFSTPVIELVTDLIPEAADEPVVAVLEPVADLAPRSHRRAAPARKAPARSGAGHAARTSGGHAGSRRKASPLPTPSPTALIAGAAAVAVATAGAIGAANSGSDSATTNASMSGAAALGLPEAAAAPLAESASVDREQVRASRERARDALADRVAAAAALKKKQEAAARALAAAKARAAQLAQLAKNYSLPVSGYRLTAGFGEGGYRWSSSHTGLDFACAYGSPIRAVAAGTVIFAGYDGAYGWKTVVRHADGTESWYAHQSQILVRRGQVAAGQVIGRVGMTGNTSGPHLHLEIRIKENPVNPLTWLRSKGLRI